MSQNSHILPPSAVPIKPYWVYHKEFQELSDLCVDAVHVARAEPCELSEDVVGEDVHPEEALEHRELHQEPAHLAQHAEVVLALVTEMISLS